MFTKVWLRFRGGNLQFQEAMSYLESFITNALDLRKQFVHAIQ